MIKIDGKKINARNVRQIFWHSEKGDLRVRFLNKRKIFYSIFTLDVKSLHIYTATALKWLKRLKNIY